MCEVCVRVDLFKAGRFKDLPGDTYLFNRLLVWVSGEDISLVPLNIDDPMDGKTHVAGNITAAGAGFQANEDGDLVLNSERLYALSGEIETFAEFWSPLAAFERHHQASQPYSKDLKHRFETLGCLCQIQAATA